MTDIESIKQSAQLVYNSKGEPIVLLPLQQWEALLKFLKAEENYHERIELLLQGWAKELDTAAKQSGSTRAARERPFEKFLTNTAFISLRDNFLTPLSLKFSHPLLKRYGWSILPLIIITILLVNNRMYYDTFNGYDMPQHFSNMITVMETGMMPPKSEVYNYQAYQPPLFYVITACITLIGRSFVDDPFQKFTTVMLLPAALGWILLHTLLIQRALRRVHPVLRGLTLCVVTLFPLSVQTVTMFSNDLPVTILCAVATFLLWTMIRAGRQLDFRLWLRAAVVIALAVAFKTSAIILIATYILLAIYILGDYLYKRRFAAARRVAIYAGIGVILMLIPYALNTWNAMRYGNDAFGGAFGEANNILQFNDLGFFLRFDGDTFNTAFNPPLDSPRGPGDSSFWSLQYLTLHNDYYNHWNSDTYWDWPSETVMLNVHRYILPIERYQTATLLQYIAIPVSLLMGFAFIVSLIRVIFWRRNALRDGSVLVVILTLMAEGALAILYMLHPTLRPSIVHARYIGFLYPFLLIIGVMWLWRLLSGSHVWQRNTRVIFAYLYSTVFIAYTFAAFKLMWLPTHWK